VPNPDGVEEDEAPIGIAPGVELARDQVGLAARLDERHYKDRQEGQYDTVREALQIHGVAHVWRIGGDGTGEIEERH
jgi:hypothetical protein